ncbi:MAG: glucose 1-dehydrogenase [Dehalococcoidia bacterium]
MSLDLFDLTGKIAIVTGASSGLGVTFAEALAEAGADLAICARRLQKLEETGEKIRSLGRRCLVVQTDVTQPDQVENLVTKTIEEYGKIDILVNNAGRGGLSKIAETGLVEEFKTILDANLTSAFICSQRVGKEMLARGYGKIINIASVEGLRAGPSFDPSAAYVPSKHAMVGLTKEFAVQWAKRGVSVNAIAPAFFPAELTERFFSKPEIASAIADHTPMGRPGKPEELKGIVVFLASDASGYVTGQTICVDGGWTAW